MEWRHDSYLLTDDANRLDIDAICTLLQQTYWAAKRPRELVEKCIQHSLCFGLFRDGKQVGFGRVITDYATVSYLCDVVIHPEYRGKGIGRWVIDCILAHPKLQGTRFDLFTKDAQSFYRSFGFTTHVYESLVKYPPGYTGEMPGN